MGNEATQRRPGFALWITGLPGSGKSTLTAYLVDRLATQDVSVQVLESDVMRKRLVPALGYEHADRDLFYHLLAAVGELLVENGVNVIFDATASERRFRDAARERIERFAEIFVRCPLEVCVERDPKHLYERAKKGILHDVPGIQSPYEPPLAPEATVDSTASDPAGEADSVIRRLRELGLLKNTTDACG